MKEVLHIVLDERELLELCQIVIDDDEAGALRFLNEHLRKEVWNLLEGG